MPTPTVTALRQRPLPSGMAVPPTSAITATATASGAFASAVMLRLLVQGMQALGLDSTAVPAPRLEQGPHVQLAAKRALLQAAVAQGGLGCLLQLGMQARLEPSDPIHRALDAACGVDDLLARWGRLEPVVHRWHRVRVRQRDAGLLVLEHVSLRPGEAPQPAESLVVLGLLAALLARQGLLGLQAHAGAVPLLPHACEQALQQLAAAGGAGLWQLRWQAGPAAPRVRGPEPVLPELCADLPWPAPALHCARWLQQDPLQRPSLAAAAQFLGMARRSLQRVLSQHGLHFSALVAEVRVRHAAWWLLQGALPIAEVGFVCGYADQAHFSRAFKRRTGWSPGAYRAGFRPTPACAPCRA